MANLYLTEQGSVLRKRGGRLIVSKDGAILLELPCHKIDSVLIFGNVQFTTQAVRELFDHGIELALLTRNGRLLGQLTSPMPKNVELRLAQYQRYRERAFTERISRTIVRGKVRNQLSLIRRFWRNHRELDLRTEAETLERLERRLRRKNSIQEFLGIEGAAARTYFGAFGKMLRHGFSFTGRKKRPATDPVNALLSLGYTLVFNEISSLLDGIGFDPYVGFYHRVDYGRPSLAADLLEEFRSPAVDRLTLRLANLRILGEEDFYLHAPSGSMHLKTEPMKRYFMEYERHMTTEFLHPVTKKRATFRTSFRHQAQNLAAAIAGSIEYVPFHYGRT